MEEKEAIAALSALAHASRLQVFRLLVRFSPEGLAAGDIASRLEIAPATLSFHLSGLEQAGLLESRREGRSIIYCVRVAGIQSLMGFLTEDCCQGRPELCQPRDDEECCPTKKPKAGKRKPTAKKPAAEPQ
jgi:DNA-binding transcriptional ArsR family regulator